MLWGQVHSPGHDSVSLTSGSIYRQPPLLQHLQELEGGSGELQASQADLNIKEGHGEDNLD